MCLFEFLSFELLVVPILILLIAVDSKLCWVVAAQKLKTKIFQSSSLEMGIDHCDCCSFRSIN